MKRLLQFLIYAAMAFQIAPIFAQTVIFTTLYAPVGDAAKHKIVLPRGTRHITGNCAETVSMDGTPKPCKTGTQVQIRMTGWQQVLWVDGKPVIIPALHGMAGVQATPHE